MKLYSTYQKYSTHICTLRPGKSVVDESLILTLREIERQKQFKKIKDAEREQQKKDDRLRKDKERRQIKRAEETAEAEAVKKRTSCWSLPRACWL